MSHYIHSWNKNLIRGLFNDFEDKISKPNPLNKLTIFSDGNNDYALVIPEYFSINCVNHGQKIKTQNGKKLIQPLKKIIYGNFDKNLIETNTVESINSVLREKISKLYRKTKKIPKDKYSLDSSICLFKFAWNFIHKRHKHLLTPAMVEGTTNKFWTWGMFLHAKISYTN